jgi:hypothetical protein
MLLRNSSHDFVFQVNEHRRHLQSLLRALCHANGAAVAFSSVDHNVILA